MEPALSSTHLTNHDSFKFIHVREGTSFLCVVSTVIKLESDNEVLLLMPLYSYKSQAKTHIMIEVFGG